MVKKLISEKREEEMMSELGFTYDEEIGKYFLGDYAFIGNVEDDVNEVLDLIQYTGNVGQYTLFSQSIVNHMEEGATFEIGRGGVNQYGEIQKKGLYCTNYKEIYCCNKEQTRK